MIEAGKYLKRKNPLTPLRPPLDAPLVRPCPTPSETDNTTPLVKPPMTLSLALSPMGNISFATPGLLSPFKPRPDKKPAIKFALYKMFRKFYDYEKKNQKSEYYYQYFVNINKDC